MSMIPTDMIFSFLSFISRLYVWAICVIFIYQCVSVCVHRQLGIVCSERRGKGYFFFFFLFPCN